MNYVFCTGDSNIVPDWDVSRGVFVPSGNYWRGFAGVTDGTSNTIAVSETARPSDVMGFGAVVVTVISGTPPKAFADLAPLYIKGQKKYAATVTPYPTNRAQRGYRWAEGLSFFSGFSTVFPPNNGHFGENGNHSSGHQITGVGSYHSGGVNAAMLDGGVRFISETIDTGAETTPARTFAADRNAIGNWGSSPFGVWGSLGSATGGESSNAP